MLKIKSIGRSFYNRAYNYNLFIPTEHDYDNYSEDPIISIKKQKYATRLYTLLFIVCMYILFYGIIMKPQSRTIVITDIDVEKFNKLYSEFGDILSCPCSTITISYETFLSHTIKFHNVCSSLFISNQWIELVYLPDRGRYGEADFRTVASSQFQILSSFCSLSQYITEKNEIILNKTKLISTDLLSEMNIRNKVNATIKSFKSSMSTQVSSFIDYFRIVTRANYFISSLNTNVALRTYNDYVSGELLLWILEAVYFPYKPQAQYQEFSPCSSDNPITPIGFFTDTESTDGFYYETWELPVPNSTIVNGFFASCTPLEGLLNSTFDCLYETSCLQLLTEYFPSLKNFNLNDYVLHSKKSNLTLYEHLSNLFIDEWITIIDYPKYFHNCNPSFCTYTITDKINYSSAITLFISLYGGLIMILRLISPFLINIFMKIKDRNNHCNIICLPKFVQWIKKLNLFKQITKREENNIKQQKISTRVYLILLISSIAVLLFFNILNTQTVILSVARPSLNTYIDLQKQYPKELKCPCSTMIIPYNRLVTFSPSLHQICSSNFTSNKWLSILQGLVIEFTDIDWRSRAYQSFSLLSNLCQLANQTIDNSIDQFLLEESFIISNIITENDFYTQINNSLSRFYRSTLVGFLHRVDAVDLHMQVDQFFMYKVTHLPSSMNVFSIINMITNDTSDTQFLELLIPMNYIQNMHSKLVQCFCSTYAHCQRSSAIFDGAFLSENMRFINYSVTYLVPGSIVGCSILDSLLLSTFECLYSDSICFSTLINYIKDAYEYQSEYLSWFDVKPLVYNSTLTRFYRNASMSLILKDAMIEQWNPSYSYDTFYRSCSPSYCFYPKKIRGKDAIGLITTLLSLIGGLVQSLHLITPYLVSFVLNLIRKTVKNTQQQVHIKWSQRFKLLKQQLKKSVYDAIFNLNIFPPRYFGSNLNQNDAKRLGQLTTRLYILILIISFVILALYLTIQRQIITKTFNEPSFDTYKKQLIPIYGQNLKCLCSSIASSYSQFVRIELEFHQICSSKFISDEIIDNLRMSLSNNVSIYEKDDYGRFVSSHFQYLQGLCRLSIESTNNTIKQFLSTLFITKQLLSENDFNQSINSSIEQIKINAPTTLYFLFFLIRNINHGNSIVSTYGTNFKYIAPVDYETYFLTQSVIYDNECSCGVYSNCTSQAYYIDKINQSDRIAIEGFKVGCLPSESLLSSTLQCLYNVSCIDLIQKYMNSTDSLEPLRITTQSQMNKTINELINQLFIVQWLPTINYSSYFQDCSPSLCSYDYIQKFNIIYIISYLLGLQGGLMIALKWICPKLMQSVIQLNKYRKKRSNTIQSECTLEVQPTDPTVQPQMTTPLLKRILTCSLLISLLIVLVIFSIYFIREQNTQVIQTNSSTTVITSTTTIDTTKPLSSSTTTNVVPMCQPIFEKIILFPPGSAALMSFVAADFNHDNQTDISFISLPESTDNEFNNTEDSVFVLLSNGNGTFVIPTMSSRIYTYAGTSLTTADFNHDDILDIVSADYMTLFISILLGNGDGTFEKGTTFFETSCSKPTGLSVGDFNNDNHFDIVVACFDSSKVIVFFGNSDGNFPSNVTLNTEKFSKPSSTAVNDFNNDNYSDIVVICSLVRTISIFIGHGNGSFDPQKIYRTGGGLDSLSITVADLNEDTKQDVFFPYISKPAIGVMFGHGNGSFSEKMRLNFTSGYAFGAIAVNDINNDGHLDIIVPTFGICSAQIFLGHGNGNFDIYRILAIEPDVTGYVELKVGDFNNDHYQDIVLSCIDTGSMYIFLNKGQCNTSAILETSTFIY